MNSEIDTVRIGADVECKKLKIRSLTTIGGLEFENVYHNADAIHIPGYIPLKAEGTIATTYVKLSTIEHICIRDEEQDNINPTYFTR